VVNVSGTKEFTRAHRTLDKHKKLNKESVVNGRIIDILTCTVCTIAMSMRFPLFKCIHLYKRIHSWKHSLSKSTSLPAVSQVINCLKLKIQRIEFVLRKM
jgi:hypothetical protein